MTPAEYRAMEREAPEKHILWNGEVFPVSGPPFAMAGASIAHDRIVGAMVAALGRALRGKECEAFPSDMRVWIPSVEGCVHPDVTVACAPLDLERLDGVETLRNPRIVFEVLSETSEAFDRGAKFDGYRSVASLSDYVLVSSVRREVDHFARQADGGWLLRAYRDRAIVPIGSLRLELAMDELYERALPGVGELA